MKIVPFMFTLKSGDSGIIVIIVIPYMKSKERN